eukprot:9052847-Ditylum_brightwellii.AAC.1
MLAPESSALQGSSSTTNMPTQLNSVVLSPCKQYLQGNTAMNAQLLQGPVAQSNIMLELLYILFVIQVCTVKINKCGLRHGDTGSLALDVSELYTQYTLMTAIKQHLWQDDPVQ